jgi:predicted ATPase/class 3 adenylate cyclase
MPLGDGAKLATMAPSSADSASIPELPTGTLTFCFTDIEGSTRLLSRLGDAYPELLEGHAEIIRRAIAVNEGFEVSTEGDAFFAVFTSPADAVRAVVQAQLELAGHPWRDGELVRVRIGLHTGEGTLGGDNYVGLDVHRAARIAAAGHGGQVLLSATTAALVGGGLPPGVALRELGVHRLKDLAEPERISQLVIPGLEAEFPPLRAQRPGNLPQSRTSFIGRAEVVAAVAEMLGANRLVTLLGPGGAGKTRLALQVAAELADGIPDGAFFVPLEVIREVELLPSAIASALELREVDEPPLVLLQRELATRDLLLVLDNLEQILPGAGETVDALLTAAPGLRVLATSRIPLRLYGEQEYPIPPLSVPTAGTAPSLDELRGCEAVALFIARARATRPSFALHEANAPAVAEITARLDGQPLAIELAAARIKLLTPEAILARLSQSLDVLATTSANLPPRQRSLRGAIAWSYELLEPAEAVAFRRLSVCAGGCDVQMVEQLVGGDALTSLESLVDKSLMRQADVAGEPRFAMLETIREFGVEQLAETGEADEAHQRLVELMLERIEAAEPRLQQAEDDGTFARLEADYGNVRGALRAAIAAASAEPAQRIVAAIWRYWQRQGLLEEGAWWIDQVLALSEEPTPARARALIAAGSIAYWREDYPAARGPYEDALAVYRQLGDAAGIAWATYNLAFAHVTLGEVERARDMFREARDGFVAVDDAIGRREATNLLGWTELMLGNPDAAEPYMRESLAMVAGDTLRGADYGIGMAQVHRMRGDHAEARRILAGSLAILRDARNLGIAVGVLYLFATTEVEDGDTVRGVRLYGAADALRERIGGGPPRATMMLGEPLDAARAAIGDTAVDEALAAGRSMQMDDAISLALESR